MRSYGASATEVASFWGAGMGVQPLPALRVFLIPPMGFGARVLGPGGVPRCLCSLAWSCIQIAAVPWPGCGDSPGDTSPGCWGLVLVGEAEGGSRTTGPMGLFSADGVFLIISV